MHSKILDSGWIPHFKDFESLKVFFSRKLTCRIECVKKKNYTCWPHASRVQLD